MILSNEFGHFKEQNSSDVEFDDQTTSIIELGKTDLLAWASIAVVIEG